MSLLRTLRQARRASYRASAILGDVSAIASGKPSRIAKRLVNKVIGRKVVRRLWWR
ncbi:MAG: hypothetical protein ABR592_01985 [Nitriliruptorales bacterium]